MSRVAADECAVFVEDTVHPVTAVAMGASPSGVVMLSPSRNHYGVAPRHKHQPTPPSARRQFATDISINDMSSNSQLNSEAMCTVTPLANRRRFFASTPGAVGVIHTATSPISASPGTVSIQEYRALEAGYERLMRMYDHVSQRAVTTEEQRSAAQALADEKIIEIISLSSRLEESKRFTKQLKGELREAKARALPHFNAVFTDAARIEAKYEERLRTQEEEFRAAMDEATLRVQSLEDALDALGISTSFREALVASFAERQALSIEVSDIAKQRDAMEVVMKGKIQSLQAELHATKQTAAAEKKRLIQRFEETSKYSVRLEHLAEDLQRQIGTAEERIEELESLIGPRDAATLDVVSADHDPRIGPTTHRHAASLFTCRGSTCDKHCDVDMALGNEEQVSVNQNEALLLDDEATLSDTHAALEAQAQLTENNKGPCPVDGLS